MNMKKLISMVLALVMLLAMSATAMAYTVSAPNNGHTYEVYQIFVGDLSADGTILSNIKWGANGTGTANATVDASVLTELEGVVGASSDTAKLAVITKYANLNSTAYGTLGKLPDADATEEGATKFVESLTGVPAGYYLIKDADDSLDGQYEAYTLYIVQIVNDVTIEPKGEVPTVDKEIVGGTTTETGDYSIGDVINYKITGTLPSNYADYKEYKYVFHDTLSAGLTYNSDAKVYVVNGDDRADVTSSFTAAFADQKLTLTCNDLKKIANVTISATSKIVVEYTATLDSDAVVGGKGNDNVVYLEFSNDPNHSGEGTPTGNTPKDEVVVFTFELDVTKVDGKNNELKLQGAEFKLRNSANEWVTVDANGKVTGWAAAEEAGSVLTSDANGFFKISGLEDGTYYLKETKAPDGYNLLTEEITVVIASTYDEEGVKTLTITVGTTTANGDTANGIVATVVKNNKGASLPETGAQGTKMIYMVGGILVAAAAILLITKRRMNAAE
ncbi:MAG: SpaH/EbpB family LPXTG-anchored major pilin [Clostridia bacterium]|nr:SpaH/EbpB family LPXTG-anchored major pilin [Clostridia bacterium]